MKQLIDFIPLIIFFVVYKMTPRTLDLFGYSFELGGIFSATAVLMAASVIVYGGLWLKNRTIEKGHIVTVLAVGVFGTMTLVFRDEMFLKWKAPIVNWVFAVAFFVSQFVGSKPIVQRMMDHVVQMPDTIWRRMNMSWVFFFLFLGAANLYVAFTFHNIWVDFKVFGSLIITFLFIIFQMILFAKYMHFIGSKKAKEASNDNHY